jgi:hypothetical protein
MSVRDALRPIAAASCGRSMKYGGHLKSNSAGRKSEFICLFSVILRSYSATVRACSQMGTRCAVMEDTSSHWLRGTEGCHIKPSLKTHQNRISSSCVPDPYLWFWELRRVLSLFVLCLRFCVYSSVSFPVCCFSICVCYKRNLERWGQIHTLVWSQ